MEREKRNVSVMEPDVREVSKKKRMEGKKKNVKIATLIGPVLAES